MSPDLEFCLLGPLTVRSGGTAVPIARAKQRVVLAALLLNANRVVTVDALAEALWGEDPPPSARSTVRNYVKRLRDSLGETGRARISTQPSGYCLLVQDGELDVQRFEALLAEARAAARDGSWASAAGQAEAALTIWRGEALAGVDSGLLAEQEAPRLAEMRLRALEIRASAMIHLGRHDEVIGELQRHVTTDPLREHFHGLLMDALHRDGRQAEALAAYQHAYEVLMDALGTEPGAELRELHHRILTGEPAAGEPAAAEPGPGTGAASPAPRQLPAAVFGFIGRAAELTALTDLAMLAGPGPHGWPRAVVISAIRGTAGVGKTTLAVHWAHQAAGQFPDGQLYLDLRGFGPVATPVTAMEAIRLFLESLGVGPEQMPASPDGQAALYRSLLAGRRMLIVLDNARDPAQVRPLLPGSPGCLVLITSRNQLTGLAVAEGAHLLRLDVLTEAEAGELLARRLGPGRVAAEPAAAAELIRLCARLPLALAIAAARAAEQPDLPLATLAAGLRDSRSRLDGLSTSDAATDIRTVFSWSCQQLSAPAARMFQLLGLHPGPDITAAAAASLAGLPPGEAHQALAELGRAHLITEPVPGRYASHDLLSAYAVEQAASQHSNGARHDAVHRMLDHYLHAAGAASLLLHPERNLVALAAPQPLARPEELASREQALGWFQAERQVLLALIGQAASSGFNVHAWQLPWSTATYFHWHGYWQELITTQELALAAASKIGDLTGQAHAQHFLGQAKARLGAYAESATHLTAARELGYRAGDLLLEARAAIDLGRTYSLQGRDSDAAAQASEALRLYRAAGHRPGEANSLNAVGWSFAQVGRYQEAVDCTQAALALHRELGNQFGAATTLDSLGYAHYHLGRYAEAIACYTEAIEVIGDVGDRRDHAEIMLHLGDAQQAAGEHEAAWQSRQRALAILDNLDQAAAEQVRARLAGSA